MAMSDTLSLLVLMGSFSACCCCFFFKSSCSCNRLMIGSNVSLSTISFVGLMGCAGGAADGGAVAVVVVVGCKVGGG